MESKHVQVHLSIQLDLKKDDFEQKLVNPNQNASSRHACHKFATSLRKLAAILT